jgi:hypothetical protein
VLFRSREVREAWVRRYLREDVAAYSSVRVCLVGSLAYLDDEGAALLEVEVLRARGIRHVKVRIGPAPRAPRGAACPEEPPAVIQTATELCAPRPAAPCPARP